MTIIQEFYLKEWDWWVKVFYIVDSIPIDFIVSNLKKIGMTDESEFINLFEDAENKGYTYSNLSRNNLSYRISTYFWPWKTSFSYTYCKRRSYRSF